MSKTKIEWTEKTWNVFTGCDKVSPGCDNCYAKPMANRFKGMNGYPADNPFKPTFHPDRLDQPLKWKKGCKIFICSMGDLFHKDNSFDQIAAVYGVMAACPEHTFQILTKRPKRMREFYEWVSKHHSFDVESGSRFKEMESRDFSYACYSYAHKYLVPNRYDDNLPNWPLPNLIHGVTAENQDQLNKRATILLELKAKGYILKTFVSIEPLLGAVKLDDHYLGCNCNDSEYPGYCLNQNHNTKLDWVIVGGENGHKARPMHPDWVRSIRDQCKEAGTPFFFKGWGEFAPYTGDEICKMDLSDSIIGDPKKLVHMGSKFKEGFDPVVNATQIQDGVIHFYSLKVGKKKAGSFLDGVEYKEMPKTKQPETEEVG